MTFARKMPVDRDEAHSAEKPPATLVIGRSYDGRQLPFALDRPFDLLGGDRLGPDDVAASLPFDWIDGMAATVAEACRRQVASDRCWFQLPPTALVGKPGVGRTHVARQLARAAGVPFVRFDVSELTLGHRCRAPDTPRLAAPILAMAAANCANPIVLVEGVDGSSPDACALLSTMIDRQTSRRWMCESLGAAFDVSCVSWLVATGDMEALHPSLHGRLDILPIEISSVPDDRSVRALGILLEAMADLDIDAGAVSHAMAPMITHAGWSALADHSAAAIYRAASDFLRNAVDDGARPDRPRVEDDARVQFHHRGEYHER